MCWRARYFGSSFEHPTVTANEHVDSTEVFVGWSDLAPTEPGRGGGRGSVSRRLQRARSQPRVARCAMVRRRTIAFRSARRPYGRRDWAAAIGLRAVDP